MLVELSVMEQRYQAVLAVVQDGWTVSEVAERLGVSRQSVHTWIVRYEAGGLAALAGRAHRPKASPQQVAPELEAMICELRRCHPGWGPRRIEHQLARQGCEPVPSRSSIYRCLKRHRQMDIMAGVLLSDETELKVVTGIDDHSRFCVAAGLVARVKLQGRMRRAVCLTETLRHPR